MAEVPRLRALFEKVQGRSVLVMPRADWDAASVNSKSPVILDVERTPLAHIASQAVLIAVVAQQTSPTMAEVAIFRDDPKDAPTPINQDKYSVFLCLHSHPDLQSLITRASTEDNANLRQCLSENVFLVKQRPGNDHWLTELPLSVSTILRST